MKAVLAEARKIVTPTSRAEREKNAIAGEAFRLIDGEASRYPEIRGVEFGGSYPKGTWLPEKADVDVFIKFDASTSRKKFTEITKKIGFTSLKKYGPYVRFSEHPYVEADMRGTKVNVVPCYLVQMGSWKSSTDRTQFHTKFMLENLSGPMKGSVRLLKRFLINNGIYGAEISQQGFSGYITEVLVWNFGSFEGVMRAIAQTETQQVIGKSTKEFDTAITVMDPVDSQRNLAAAVSSENVGRFVLLCRSFLKNPSVSYFTRQKKRASRVLLKNCIAVEFEYGHRSPDIIWGQLKRATSTISTQLGMAGFKVIRSRAYTDERKKAGLYFLLESTEVSGYHINTGPEFFSRHDSSRFVSQNAKKSLSMWVAGDGRILSLEKREGSAKKFLADLLRNRLARSGIPSGIKSDIRQGCRISMPGNTAGKSVKAPLLELVSTDATIFPAN